MPKSLKISVAIYILLGVSLLCGSIASTYLLFRCARINAEYQKIFEREVAQAEQIRVIQVSFKKQVQAWKDILLRGQDPAAFTQYSQEFHRLSQEVQQSVQQLDPVIADPQSKQVLSEFGDAHRELNSRYEAALSAFAIDKNPSEADSAVKGMDRKPTDLLDNAVQELSDRVRTVPEEESKRLHNEQTVLVTVLLVMWIAIFAWGISFVRLLAARLNRSVLFIHKVASGDLTAESPYDDRHDELGLLTKSMEQMRQNLRGMIAEVRNAVEHIAISIEDITVSSSQIAHGATVQREQAVHVSSSMQEMTATVSEVNLHCNATAATSQSAGRSAENGGRAVEATVESIRALAESAKMTSAAMRELGESSRQIGQVVTVIDEIAEQTNLLALNASIEAARAGEHGRGFSIVANEVRKLAERTTTATSQIASAVKAIQSSSKSAIQIIEKDTVRVENSVSAVDKAAESLHVLVRGTNEVQDKVAQIAAATSQQTAACEEISRSMQEIVNQVHTTSEGAEEAARACESLTGMSRSLQNLVAQFKTDSDGASPVHAGHPVLRMREQPRGQRQLTSVSRR